MDAFIKLFLEKFQLLTANHPTLGFIGIALGAVLVGGIACFRMKYALQEKAISLNAARFQPLMDVLQADNAAAVNPLYLELAYQKAFGKKQSFDEITFALRHRNPTKILFDLWHGRLLVKLNPERTGVAPRGTHRFSLRTREKVVDATFTFLAAPAFLFAFVYAFYDPAIGLMYVAEFTLFSWMLLSSTRSLACARSLLEGEYANDLRIT